MPGYAFRSVSAATRKSGAFIINAYTWSCDRLHGAISSLLSSRAVEPKSRGAADPVTLTELTRRSAISAIRFGIDGAKGESLR
jgi:hypothetical protein